MQRFLAVLCATWIIFGVLGSAHSMDIVFSGTEHGRLEGNYYGYEEPINIVAEDRSMVDVASANFGGHVDFSAYGSSTVNWSDSDNHARQFSMHDTSTLNFYDGTAYYGGFDLYDSATVNYYGGTLDLEAYGSNTINVYGGSFYESTWIGGTSKINMYDGHWMTGSLFGEGVGYMYGGSLDRLFLNDQAILHIFGNDLDLIWDESGTWWAVAGAWADGTSISAGGRIVDDSQIILHDLAVPEPSTIFLLGFGLLGFAGFRRRFTKLVNPKFF